jgi:hypothetical protein
MSPDRHDRPLQSGLSGSGSTSTGSSSKDASNEAGRAGETGVDAPQFEWVYNSDHTDTVNFGYMFLKPVGTRPTLASGPAHIPVLKPPTIQVISKPRTQNELHLPVTIPPTRDNIIRQSSQSLSPDSGASSSSPAQSDQFQPFGRAPQTLSGSSSQQRASTSQNIPYRSDRGYGKSTNTSQEQFTAPNLQWSAQVAFSASNPLTISRQQNQDSPISLNSSSTPIHNTPLNLQDNHRRDSLDHSGYIASATPIITPEAFIRPTLPPRNEKRKARNSPILSHSMNPISTTTSFQPIIRKRRLLNPQHSKGTVFATNLSLCTRCQQYQIPVSGHRSFHSLFPTDMEYLTENDYRALSQVCVHLVFKKPISTNGLAFQVPGWKVLSLWSYSWSHVSLSFYCIECSNKRSTHGGMSAQWDRECPKRSIMATISI